MDRLVYIIYKRKRHWLEIMQRLTAERTVASTWWLIFSFITRHPQPAPANFQATSEAKMDVGAHAEMVRTWAHATISEEKVLVDACLIMNRRTEESPWRATHLPYNLCAEPRSMRRKLSTASSTQG